uniref:Chitin-binding type-2 domain-containing protein n=1 Tax=Anopheles culicifacies TaxID=139723 RepID=A0A182MNU3_9DIPT
MCTMLTNVFVLFSISVCAVYGANIDPRCSRYSLTMKAQVLSYQLDCRKFVICDMGGYGQVLSCPPGLYFSEEAHACSFDTAFCTHGELGNAIDTLPLVPSIPKPSLPAQPLPVPVPIPHIPVKPQPMPPVNQNTDPKPSLPNLLPIITAPPPTVVAPVEEQPAVEHHPYENACWEKPAGKLYPIAHDCGLYVVCMGDNNAIVQRCPKGLLYDHRHQRCEYSDASHCAIPRNDAHLVLDVNGVDMALLEEERLSALLEESDTVPVVSVKEDISTLFAEMVQREHKPVLLVPEQAQKQPEPVVEYTFRMIDNHPRCLARNNVHLTIELPHDTDCSKYLVCVGRVAIEKKCPSGQHWNARHNWCDFASLAGCSL